MVVAFIIVLTAEVANSRFFPLPAGIDFSNMNSVREAVATLPDSAFILVLLGWAGGAFAGALLASRLAGRRLQGTIVGGLLLAVAVLNLISLPHPGWVWAVALAVFPAGGYAGIQLGTRA
jgi:predicted MFS family arabinose efflux permease